jgi:WD40 repeat protein
MTDLFLSYSRRDQAFVRELHRRLETVGKDAWVDWENIPLTAEWLQEIYDGIEAAHSFAYVITPDSVRSEVCSLELAHAISHNKRLVPILRRELVEDMDKKALDPKISSHNWIYFRETDDFEKAFHSLTDALDTDLDYLKTHTRLLIKAVEWNDKERDSGLVLRGNDLRLAVQWLQQSADKQPTPTDLQREYIQSSQRAATARVRALTLYAVYGIVVVLLAGFAFLQALSAEERRQEAEEQRHVAEDNALAAQAAKATAVYNGEQALSLALASNAQQILYRDKNPELALALSLVANTAVEQPPILAQGALAQAAYFPGTRYIIDDGIADFSRIAADYVNRRLLYVNHENALLLKDLSTRDILQQWSSASAEPIIRSVALTPDGAYAAAGYSDGHIFIYNTVDGTTFREIIDESADDSNVWDMEFSPDGRFLVGAYGDGRARVWDWRAGTLVTTFGSHMEVDGEIRTDVSLYAITVRPDSAAVLTIDDTMGALMLWDIQTGELISRFDAEVGAGRAVAFLPDGKSAFVAYDDTVIRWVDLETLTVLREYVGHTDPVWEIAVTPDGQQILSGSFDNAIIDWDIDTGEILQQFEGHSNSVYGLAILKSQFVSASIDGTLRYWDLASGAQINEFAAGGSVNTIYPLEDGDTTTVIVAPVNGIVQVLDENLVSQRSLSDAQENLRALDITSEHDLAVMAVGNPSVVTVLNLSDGSSLKQKELDFRVSSLQISSDGDWIVLVGRIADIVLWNWKTDEERRITTATAQELGDQIPLIRTVRFNLDGTQVFVGGISGVSNNVLAFDTASGELIQTYSGHKGSVYSIDLSTDGRYIVSASEDRSLIVWSVDQSTPPSSFYGHTSTIRTVRFSPNARLLVSGGDDNTVRLWDINTGNELQRFDTSAPVVSVAFGADNNTVYSGTDTGVLQHWQIRDLRGLLEWITSNRYMPELTCEQKALYQISQETCDV